MLMVANLGAVIGIRVFWLAEHGISNPSRWVGTNGFTFDGVLIASTLPIGVYLEMLWNTTTPPANRLEP